MKQLRLAALLLTGSVQFLFAEGGLGERTLWDAQTSRSKWETAGGISAGIEGGALVIRGKEVDFGWAAPTEAAPFVADAIVDIEVKQAVNGQLAVQVEWLRENGSFISATNLLKEGKAGMMLTGTKLAGFRPQGEKPKSFRLKFWVEGKGAEVQIVKASVKFERKWRKADTRLVKALDAKASVKPDDGIRVQAKGEILSATLDAKTGYAAFTFDGLVDYDPKSVALLDLAGLQNGVVEVQALCWNTDGSFLKSVDVLKDIPTSGVYEVPFKALEFPAGTTKLSFKVWLSGKETAAQIAGLFYGVAP